MSITFLVAMFSIQFHRQASQLFIKNAVKPCNRWHYCRQCNGIFDKDVDAINNSSCCQHTEIVSFPKQEGRKYKEMFFGQPRLSVDIFFWFLYLILTFSRFVMVLASQRNISAFACPNFGKLWTSAKNNFTIT